MTAEQLLERMAEQTLTEADAAGWAAHATREQLWSVADESVQLLYEAFAFLETPHSDITNDVRIIQQQAGVVAAIHEALALEQSDGEDAT